MPPMSTTLKLNDGHEIPRIGFGVWQISNGEAPRAVRTAIEAGYRLIDTAAAYGNEAGVGGASRARACPARSCSSPPSCGTTAKGTTDAPRRSITASRRSGWTASTST